MMLHTMHAPELLSFVDLFHHQHEAGEDSAHNDVGNGPHCAASLRSPSIV